jgi:GAF domain-containing protein
LWDDHAVGDRAVHTTEPYPAQLVVENERLQRALRARLKEEEALRRVATLVAREHAPGAVLALVTEEVGRHLEADTAVTVRHDAPGRATFVATWTAPHVDPSPFRVGRQIEPVPRGALARALETVAPARVDSYEGLPGSFAREVRASGIRATVAAPILVDGNLWGAFAAGSNTAPFGADAEARLGAFAELVAQAVANVDARIKLKESRARIVAAADDARRRIERDLHDGAQQRLVALALSL